MSNENYLHMKPDLSATNARKVLLSVKHGHCMPTDRSMHETSWQELHDQKKECASAMRAILNQAEDGGRELSADEQKTFDFLANLIEHQEKEIRLRESNGTRDGSTPGSRFGGSKRTAGAESEWTDSDGRPVALLGRHDSFADHVARQTGQHHARLPSTTLAKTIQSMVTGDHSQLEQVASAGGFNASLLTGADPSGGYFVNPTLAGTMIDHARSRSTAIQAGVRTLPMTSPETRLVRVDNDPEFQFTGEGQELKESPPPFGSVRLVAKKMAVAIPISAELLEDAVGLQAELDRLLGESIGTSVDSAIYTGDGSKGSFTGILAAKHVQEHGAALPKLLSWDDLLESQYLIDQANLGSDANLVLPPSMARQLRGQKDGQGRYIDPPSDMSELRPLVSTNLPATSGVFGRFMEGILGIRSQLSIMVNPYTLAKRDMYLITARWRGDFALTRPKGIVKLTGFDGTTE